jgi:hypothetical protein
MWTRLTQTIYLNCIMCPSSWPSAFLTDICRAYLRFPRPNTDTLFSALFRYPRFRVSVMMSHARSWPTCAVSCVRSLLTAQLLSMFPAHTSCSVYVECFFQFCAFSIYAVIFRNAITEYNDSHLYAELLHGSDFPCSTLLWCHKSQLHLR